MTLEERFRGVDDHDLFEKIRQYADREVALELTELEHRFWCHKLGEKAAQDGLTLAQFFQLRIGDRS